MTDEAPGAARPTDDAGRARLRLPPPAADPVELPPGRSTIRVGGRPAGLLYAPPTGATRLIVMLHGAGGSAEHALRMVVGEADRRRLMVFAPQSVGTTWDLIETRYGPDVARIQDALSWIAAGHRWAGGRRIALGGFSDGASYALSLGLTNGDIVDAVVAFSPGFTAPAARVGVPACFVSHGRADRVLPIGRCGRRVVAALRRDGYPVRYEEFDGGHEVPPAIVAQAMAWLPAVGPGG